MILYSSRLFVALLFHVVITTQQMPEEVNNFWRACREKHCLPSKPNRSQPSHPSHALVASTSIPSVTWTLLCTQVCSAGHEGSALLSAL